MKIRVNGETVDTEQIFKITKVIGNDCWKNTDNRGLSHSAYEFTILFLDKKEIKISLSGSQVFKEDHWYSNMGGSKVGEQFPLRHPQYLERLILIRDRLTELRNEIEAVWLANQSTLPQFGFDEDFKPEIKNVTSQKKSLLTKIEEILEGIEDDDTNNNKSFWETSAGVEYGKSCMNKIRALFK